MSSYTDVSQLCASCVAQMCRRWVSDVSHVCIRCVSHVHACLRCVSDVSQMCLMCVSDVCLMYMHVSDVSQMCLMHSLHASNIFGSKISSETERKAYRRILQTNLF